MPALRGGGWLRTGLAGCLLALCAAGCDGSSSAPPPPPVASRFEAVKAAAPSSDQLAGFCDKSAQPQQGAAFRFPAVEGSAPAGAGQERFLWLNIWATWCKPCVEEMPMIASWQKRLASEGKALDVQFVSVDEDAAAVPAFRTQHPSAPPSLHIADPKALAPLIAELGLDSGAGLPIHVFVEKGARVRCVRAGAVTESHYPIVAGML
jgi:thiol-disulfide isomerase/thioredoxin